jgi:parvulin-like peptidyl-prolyl isomerase
LQPGQYSSIIQTLAGFHILQVLERDPQRPLDPQALLTLQNRAVADWLQTHHDQSDIQVLLP